MNEQQKKRWEDLHSVLESGDPINPEKYAILKQAAERFAEIFPLLCEFVAAGDKATQGNIDTDQGGEVTASDGTCLLAAPQYNPCPNFEKDALFFCAAANMREAIRKAVA